MTGIFIVGCQRSGTTALYNALNAHSNLRQQGMEDGRPSGTTKELWFFQEFFRGREENRHRPHFPSDFDDRFQKRFASLVDEFCTENYAGASGRWISAHPRDALYIDKIMPLFAEQEIRVIYLVRHPQEVAWSSVHAPWEPKHGRAKMLSRAVETARYWQLFGPNAVAARDGKLGPGVILVQHRNLIFEPEATVRRILDHLGEPFERTVVDELSKVSNSSFQETGSAAEQLQKRQEEISRDKVFCARVARQAQTYMRQLGFADYGDLGPRGSLYRHAAKPILAFSLGDYIRTAMRS